MNAMRYFRGSFFVTFVGLLAGAALGWQYTGTLSGAATTMFIVAVLGVLEVSLSFDNAVVNATVLTEMDPVWRRRFITWGIAIAVFGMRVVFPVLIVAVIAGVGPFDALYMAATDPDAYSHHLANAEVAVSGFGGAFLAMVGMKHFFDVEKDQHWITVIERPLSRLGRIEAVEIGLVLVLLWLIGSALPVDDRTTFLVSGMFGLVAYIAVDGVSALLDPGASVTDAVARSGVASFLYLEVLDASFSFDGVIGALALSSNIFIIAIGLGIGAMFVRSLTLMLVEMDALTEYRYLAHGAFYAISSLSIIMFLKLLLHVPDGVSGMIGAAFIGLAFLDSVRHNREMKRDHERGRGEVSRA
jgi:hypothetical protein